LFLEVKTKMFVNWRAEFHSIDQCFSTFFGSRHPFWIKTFGGTLTLVNFYFEAPLKLIIDKFHKESQQIKRKSNVLRENIVKIQYLGVPLGPLHGNLVCRGTPVENHCHSKLINKYFFKFLICSSLFLQV